MHTMKNRYQVGRGVEAGPPWIESIDLNRAPGQLTFGSVMAEGGLFYAGMFTVVAGLGLIIGIGIFSFFNPYRGDGNS